MNAARPTAAGAFDIRPIRAANELAAEWLKEILPSVNELDHLQRRFEEQSGFFESSGRQNRDGQEESEQDDEIYGDEEHRLLRARRAFCWPRLSSSRSDRLQATRADWCEGAYLVTAGRTGNRCHPGSEPLSSISRSTLRPEVLSSEHEVVRIRYATVGSPTGIA